VRYPVTNGSKAIDLFACEDNVWQPMPSFNSAIAWAHEKKSPFPFYLYGWLIVRDFIKDQSGSLTMRVRQMKIARPESPVSISHLFFVFFFISRLSSKVKIAECNISSIEEKKPARCLPYAKNGTLRRANSAIPVTGRYLIKREPYRSPLPPPIQT